MIAKLNGQPQEVNQEVRTYFQNMSSIETVTFSPKAYIVIFDGTQSCRVRYTSADDKILADPKSGAFRFHHVRWGK